MTPTNQLLTLWDLVKPRSRQRPARPDALTRRRGPARPAAPDDPRQAGAERQNPPPRSPSMADRYEALTRAMLAQYNVRVRKWRSSMTGVAWQIRYADGRIARLIEAPRPKGPMSAAIFLHEIGHHAIGFNVYRPRCLEEYHAWAWALAQMEANGLNITESVRRRMHESLWYAVDKARRRGLREIPAELAAFTTRPSRWKQRG